MESLLQAINRNMHKHNHDDNGFIHLFVSKRLIQGSAAALTAIFVPIFLYETFDQTFYIVGAYFALLSLLYCLFLVPGMHLTNKIGFSKALVVGGVFSVLQYLIFYFLSADTLWYLLIPLTITITGFRVFHWVPYNVDFTLFTKKGERGRMVSLSFATIAFLGAVGPILAGFIIANAGYEALFGVALALLVVATISYALVPEPHVHYDWGFLETIKNLGNKKYRAMTLGEFANGAEIGFTAVVWPIFLYEVFAGDVFSIGMVSTIVVGITIVLQLFVGKYLDSKKGANEEALKIGSMLYAVGWILKIFVLSAAHVFFVGLYHNIVRIFTKTPFSAILFDMSAEQGKYIDEFSVLREMSSHFGRFVSLTIVAILTLYIPLGWTFVIAALASVALNVIYRVHNS